MASQKKLVDVVRAELEEIQQRRAKSNLPQENLEGTLVGLSLSGGANRSASFSLGFVQALQKIGLWKFIDYLSTTSGGGYIGAYLTSAILKEKEAITKTHQPFLDSEGDKQSVQVKRFIYGGHYLLKPWRLANMYLMGLFFINLAIFSGLLAVCAAVAFLWRCFDFEHARIWARMLGTGGDFYAPFWPFVVFAFAWLSAWCVSLFRRGGEATGRVARYLLLATFFSFLVGVALLIGNGDIGGWNSYASGENVSFGGKVWGPIVALIIGGLLPFLSPKRLLQSGLNPQHDWERYMFKVATTALLVGLPMMMIGWLAREDISGFNSNPNRPVVAGDVNDWPSLTGMLADPKFGKLVASPWAVEPDNVRIQLASNNDGESQLGQRELAFRLAVLNATKQMRNPWVNEELGLDVGESSLRSRTPSNDASVVPDAMVPSLTQTPAANTDDKTEANKELERARRVAEEAQKKVEETKEDAKPLLRPIVFQDNPEAPALIDTLLASLALRVEKRGATDDKMIGQYTAPFLTYAAASLQTQQIELDKARAAFLGTGQWHRPSVTRYLTRLFDIASWKFRDTGAARRYWKEATTFCYARDEFTLALDEVMRQPAFTETYLAQRKLDDDGTVSAELAGLLTRAVLTDENVFTEVDGAQEETRPTNVDEWMPHERHQLARLLLEHDFPTIFRQRDKIRRVVAIQENQVTRATWFVWSLLVFVIAGMWVDVNSLSLHRYYRNRIAQSFIVPRNVKSPSVPLSDMVTTEYGGPYHLINASVGMIRRGVGEEKAFFAVGEDPADTDQRWVDSFLFSRLFCGSEVTDYVDTVAYEHSVQGYTHKVDLAEATAISGAALSPGHVQNWLLAFLMVAMNLSLGQWIPNPRVGKPRTRPRVLALLYGLLKRSFDRPYCFVSDGGHCENLGLVQLLKRRCKLIIAVDASCDPDHSFHDLGRAMRTARVHGGVRFLEMEPDSEGNERDLRLDPVLHGSGDGDKRNTKQHFVVGRIRYCNGDEGLLIYVKPCLTGDESADLVQYRNQSPEFPHEPTTDQLFDAAQVEAYRHLGYHTGMEIEKFLPRELAIGELWDYPDVEATLLCDWLTGKGKSIPRAAGAVVANPVAASKEERDAVRPIAGQIIKKMRQKFRSPADIEGHAFREMIEHDGDFTNVRPITAVAALQCAVIDRQQQKPDDREFGVWLLRSIEEDDACPTNTIETLDVLAEAMRTVHPEKVRLAAISVLCILGRGAEHREFVTESLAAHRNDAKARIRLAIRNALSNLTESPNKPR